MKPWLKKEKVNARKKIWNYEKVRTGAHIYCVCNVLFDKNVKLSKKNIVPIYLTPHRYLCCQNPVKKEWNTSKLLPDIFSFLRMYAYFLGSSSSLAERTKMYSSVLPFFYSFISSITTTPTSAELSYRRSGSQGQLERVRVKSLHNYHLAPGETCLIIYSNPDWWFVSGLKKCHCISIPVPIISLLHPCFIN